MGLRKKAITSLGWLVLLRYSARIIDILKYFIIARILSPSEIGNFMLATTVVIIIDALSDTGLQFAFIQKQASISQYAKTLWIISILRGLTLSLVILVTSPIFSYFFSSPQLLTLLISISILPLIKGFQSPYVVLFQKNLNFKKEFYFRFFPIITASILAIVFSLMFKNALGLVVAVIIGGLLETIFSFTVTKTKFKTPFSLKRAKYLFHYGKHLTMGSIFTLLMTQADSLFVGKVFGASLLAAYELSFKLANVAFTEITDIISRVAFPLYSKIQNEKLLLLKTFKKNVLAVSVPAICITVVFLLIPQQILSIIFGQNYIFAYQVLQILSIYGLLRAVVGPTGPLFLAVGKPRVTTVMNFLNLAFLLILLFPFSRMYGFNGVAIAMTIAYVLVLPYMLYELRIVIRDLRKKA